MSGSPPGKPPKPIEKALEDWRRRIADRERVEDGLRRELALRRHEYEVAKIRFSEAVRMAQDTGLNPDGAHGVNVATRHFNEALERYRKTLRTFNEFILGKGPSRL